MKFLYSRKIQAVLLVILILVFGYSANICRQLNDERRHRQYSNCFDMSTGSAVCIVENALKAYFLTMYNLDPEQRNKPQLPFLSKHNLAPFVELDLLESLHSQPRRPRGEVISKAVGRFIGKHIASHFAQNVGAGWNSRGAHRLVFVSGSLFGGYIGGEVGLMAYDVFEGYEHLYNHLFHGEGNKSPSTALVIRSCDKVE